MISRPPISTRTDTPLPCTTRSRSEHAISLIINQMIQAKASRLASANNESGRMLFANRESYANQPEAQAFTNLNKVTTSGLHGVSGTSFNDAAPAFKGLREGVSREPTLLYAAAEVAVPNGWSKGKQGLGIADRKSVV